MESSVGLLIPYSAQTILFSSKLNSRFQSLFFVVQQLLHLCSEINNQSVSLLRVLLSLVHYFRSFDSAKGTSLVLFGPLVNTLVTEAVLAWLYRNLYRSVKTNQTHVHVLLLLLLYLHLRY